MIDFRWLDWHQIPEYLERRDYPNPILQQGHEMLERLCLAWREFVQGDLLRRDGYFESQFFKIFPLAAIKTIRGGPENLFPDFYAFSLGYSGDTLGIPLMMRLVVSKALVDNYNPNLWGIASGIQKAFKKGREAAIRNGEIKLESRLQGA